MNVANAEQNILEETLLDQLRLTDRWNCEFVSR